MVVLDNVRYHHATALKPLLRTYRWQVTLLFLPPHSPHLAPIERVWKLTRRLALHNRYFTQPDLRGAISNEPNIFGRRPLTTALSGFEERCEIDMHSITDFESAGRAVLSLLYRRLGFNLWMVTRTEGDDWIVLQSEDHGYGVEPGTVFRWTDSFCSEMVKGNGPRIAPRSVEVPAYAAAPIGRQVQIGSYVGLPLVGTDGSLFGTLCAIHPSPQPESIIEEQELLELLAAMLSMILQAELSAAEGARRSEKLQVEALTDEQTGLYNRRGWDRLLASEEERCRRYGHPAAVVIVDLDELKVVNDRQGHTAGDALIVRASGVFRNVARANDIVARLGGDEFGMLIVECDRSYAEAVVERIRTALSEANVKASIGFATRDPAVGLEGACLSADQLMYKEKRSR